MGENIQLESNKNVVAVLSAQVPFTTGGAELHVRALINNLRKNGHRVEHISIPFSFSPKESMILCSLVWRMVEDLTGKIPDAVIATKFPTYLVRHPNKIVWLFHQHRAAYDLFNTPYSDFKDDSEGRYYRNLIKKIDDKTLGEAKKIFTNSKNVAQRLKQFNGIDSEALHVPPVLELPMKTGQYKDYILSVGRLTKMKRVDLLIRSLKHTDPNIKGMIVGKGDSEQQLKDLAKNLGLIERVVFKSFVSEDELIELYAHAFAVFFAPVDEDFGLVTVEAFNSKKPVITCTDSGGTLELVEEGVSGFVCEPQEEIIAGKIDFLFQNKDKCEEFGNAGCERVKDITWNNVIKKFESYF